MTGLRERIAEALVINVTPGAGWAERLADVLLSLPGVAVVELPQAEPGRLWTKFGDAMLSNHHPGLVGRPGLLHWIAPAEARKAAADLLAAARATESVTP